MFNRAFRVVGLVVRVAEAKASVRTFAARRSVMLMLGNAIGVVMACFGFSILLGAGYIALEPVVGVPVAMVAVGVTLIAVAAAISIIAGLRSKGPDRVTTEQDAQARVERVEQLLRSTLGLTNKTPESEPRLTSREQSPQSTPHSETFKGFDDPKVLLSAAVAIIGLLGPRSVFRSMRIAAALGSASTVMTKLVADSKSQNKVE